MNEGFGLNLRLGEYDNSMLKTVYPLTILCFLPDDLIVIDVEIETDNFYQAQNLATYKCIVKDVV